MQRLPCLISAASKPSQTGCKCVQFLLEQSRSGALQIEVGEKCSKIKTISSKSSSCTADQHVRRAVRLVVSYSYSSQPCCRQVML